MISWAKFGLFWAALRLRWAAWRLRRPSWGQAPGRWSPEIRRGLQKSHGSPEWGGAGGFQRPRRPGGLRKRRAGGAPNLVNCPPPPAQFSKHVFGFSKLGFVLDSSQPANLVNCPLCLENYFLNSAVVPPLSTGPTARTPPEASGGFGRPPGPSGDPMGTSGGLCGPRGTICPALAPKTASVGARRPKGALEPQNGPRLI